MIVLQDGRQADAPCPASCASQGRRLGLPLPLTQEVAHAGLMIEHALAQEHVLEVHGSIDGIMGLSKPAFMRAVLHHAPRLSPP